VWCMEIGEWSFRLLRRSRALGSTTLVPTTDGAPWQIGVFPTEVQPRPLLGGLKDSHERGEGSLSAVHSNFTMVCMQPWPHPSPGSGSKLLI
jgi:hypothetical protein